MNQRTHEFPRSNTQRATLQPAEDTRVRPRLPYSSSRESQLIAFDDLLWLDEIDEAHGLTVDSSSIPASALERLLEAGLAEIAGNRPCVTPRGIEALERYL